MTEANKKIAINGVKFEVDARTATLRQVQTIHIGARVKVLKKKYSDNFEVHHGVVVGIEPIEKNPTVIVAYIESGYSSNGPEIKFLYFNSKSEEQAIISDENDREALQASNVTAQIDKEIKKEQNEIQDLEDRKAYFLRNFQSYWNPLVMPDDPVKPQLVQ
jgi:hypothetical protein